MSQETIKQRLADPEYLDRHLLAVAILQKHDDAPWYDSHFLRYFAAAKDYLTEAQPQALDAFLVKFAPLQNAPINAPVKRNDLLDTATHQRVRDIVANLPQSSLEHHEEAQFGRQVVHDQPEFVALQKSLLPAVSAMAGEELACGYNFLCLYGDQGICAPHMDEPISMYTLDFCIDQNADWPIHFSQHVDWPDASAMRDWEPSSVLDDPALRFTSEQIDVGEALLFNGSSHWHYRDRIPAGGYSHLLFFHYHPAGAELLVRPPLWHRHFDLPVLQPLCDLFANPYPPLPNEAGAS